VTDEIWKRAEVDSPCVKICVIHPESRICIGCRRTIDEISGWARLSAEDRLAIVQALPGRMVSSGKRRGGRGARLHLGGPQD
jgi:predicted Fe-S protein YdhL (DUF1289 family)